MGYIRYMSFEEIVKSHSSSNEGLIYDPYGLHRAGLYPNWKEETALQYISRKKKQKEKEEKRLVKVLKKLKILEIKAEILGNMDFLLEEIKELNRFFVRWDIIDI